MMSNINKKLVLSAGVIAERIGATVVGDGDVEICAVNSISEAGCDEISFVSQEKAARKAADSQAGAFLVKETIEGVSACQLVVENVDAALIDILNIFAPRSTKQEGIHPAAFVEDSAELGENVSVGAQAYISHGAKIGANTQIGPGCQIGEGCVVGENTVLDSNVVIYRNCKIGSNCLIQANTTIGAIGFGYSLVGGMPKLIPHNGGVIIEDCVEIGANSCVDRAKFSNTIVGAGTKIDDQVMIAHNVEIGKCCLLAAQTGVAGSTKVGNGVIMGGHGGVGDHCTIGDGCRIGTMTAALQDWPAGSDILGFPAELSHKKMREYVLMKRLPKMANQLKDINKRISSLEASKDDKK